MGRVAPEYRMLLWISAAGLAGAGWFGWLIWRDYDWAAFGWSDIQVRGSSSRVPPSRSPSYRNVSVSQDNRGGDTLQSGSLQAENDLLGSTQTNWNGYNDLIPSEDQPFTDQPYTELAPTNEQEVDQDVNVVNEPDEDFVVVSNENGSNEQPDEGFVAVEINPLAIDSNQQAGYTSSGIENADEDFVVVGDEIEESDDDLPEVDVSDYLNQWTPVVPKIAALITHELWPQLRSYLESLPQYGDASLERVVNAVAEDVGMIPNETDGVGEGAETGFAFYATLFEQMEQADQSAELATA